MSASAAIYAAVRVQRYTKRQPLCAATRILFLNCLLSTNSLDHIPYWLAPHSSVVHADVAVLAQHQYAVAVAHLAQFVVLPLTHIRTHSHTCSHYIATIPYHMILLLH